MRVLLDTQALVILAQEGIEAFSPRVRSMIADPENDRLLSVVSVTEIAIKASIGKLDLTCRDVEGLIQDIRLTVLPYTVSHATKLFDLPSHHRDPFDRMLIATALAECVPLLASDTQFEQYQGLDVIW